MIQPLREHYPTFFQFISFRTDKMSTLHFRKGTTVNLLVDKRCPTDI